VGAPIGNCVHFSTFVLIVAHFPPVELTGAPMFNDNREQRTPPCSTTTWHKLALPMGAPTGNNASQWALPLGTALIFVRLYSLLRTPPRWSYPILLGCDHVSLFWR
jgi:hypothetical protein